MATAYAALTYVLNIIDTIRSHPRPPISLHHQQIQSLTENISFLQQFLEAGYTNQVSYDSEPDPLDMHIADVVREAEDVIESHIVDQILDDVEEGSSVDFYDSLQKVIDEMEAVKKEGMAVKEKMKIHKPQIREADSSSSIRLEQYNAMVGFDDVLVQILDKLTSNESSCEIITIAGMGGMGKSTLANNVYQHQLVVENFDIRSFVTISQQYNVTNVLLKLLEGCRENGAPVEQLPSDGEDSNTEISIQSLGVSQVKQYEIGERLHKTLMGRKYLIVIDDIWNIEAWDCLRLFLPDDNNGSRILITTRLSNLAREIDNSHNIEMPILDEDNAWKLFCKHVFREEDCPYELEATGKRIVKGCKGLPLSIRVVGGLLGKSKREKQYWEDVADNLNSIVNLEIDRHCLQILYISYYNLPVHLMPIFLFFGAIIHYEDFLPIIFLVEILIVEGLVKPISGKSLEEAGVEYLRELVERNLISIDKTYQVDYWMYRKCRIHDLLRDLCLRESLKQNFIYFVADNIFYTIPENINSIRRICVFQNTSEAVVLSFLESAPFLHSFWPVDTYSFHISSIKSRLLRVYLEKGFTYPQDAQKVNLQVIMIRDPNQVSSPFFPPLCLAFGTFICFG